MNLLLILDVHPIYNQIEPTVTVSQSIYLTPLTSISHSPPYPHLLTNTHHSSFYNIANPLYHALAHTFFNSSNPVTESQKLIYYLSLEISLQLKLFKILG